MKSIQISKWLFTNGLFKQLIQNDLFRTAYSKIANSKWLIQNTFFKLALKTAFSKHVYQMAYSKRLFQNDLFKMAFPNLDNNSSFDINSNTFAGFLSFF